MLNIKKLSISTIFPIIILLTLLSFGILIPILSVVALGAILAYYVRPIARRIKPFVKYETIAIIIGMIAMLAIKKNVKELRTDEMIQSIAGKSSLWAYSICIPILALLSIFFMFSNLSDKGSDMFNLGMVLSYVVLFHIAIYSIAFIYFKNKYNSDDK